MALYYTHNLQESVCSFSEQDSDSLEMHIRE